MRNYKIPDIPGGISGIFNNFIGLWTYKIIDFSILSVCSRIKSNEYRVTDNNLRFPFSNCNFAQNTIAMQSTTLNNAQIEILDMMSFVKSQEALADLKQVISNFFASELEKEMNQLWESGEMTEEKVEGFRNLHERTPYK